MQDSHLCCPPYFFLGPAVAPHFFISRITTDCASVQSFCSHHLLWLSQ